MSDTDVKAKDTTKDLKHPFQPVGLDEHGVLRFKENEIVRYILDFGNITLNDIAVKNFPREDRVQFAQLIGYSVSGFGELTSYVSDEDYETADSMYRDKLDEKDARIKVLEEKLRNVRRALKAGISELYSIAEEDLTEE
jgi:hypothetical protein